MERDKERIHTTSEGEQLRLGHVFFGDANEFRCIGGRLIEGRVVIGPVTAFPTVAEEVALRPPSAEAHKATEGIQQI